MTNLILSQYSQSVYWFLSPETSSTGSALGVSIQGKLCLITAKHCVSNLSQGDTGIIKIFQGEEWKNLEVIPYFCEGDIDIVVLKTNTDAAPLPARTLSQDGLALSQDVFFLGFPFPNNIPHPPVEINNDFPLPFVKKASVSSMQGTTIYLDGHNNQGFSGGPVVYTDIQSNVSKVCGVVSGYITHQADVVEQTDATKALKALENSGIFVAYSITPAIELITSVYGVTIEDIN